MRAAEEDPGMTFDPWRRGAGARRITIATGVLALAIAAIALAIVAGLVPGCGRRARPNVLLVTLDTTRADHVGCYGATPSPTPNFDRLAREGVLFEQAMTPVPLTLPSHATMFTGQIPSRHGVRVNGAYVLPPSAETLAEAFGRAGYQTGAFVSAFVLHRQFGLAQGFDAYDDSLVDERSGLLTTARALRWLDRRDPQRPFFLWVHFFDPHTPWTPARAYRSLPLPSPYDQEIAAADGSLGEILDWLRARRLLDRTLVAVVGDHGEGLGDHGEAEHGLFLYREAVHVPWVMRLPGAKPAGTRLTTLVGTIDLAPTLCELAGLPPLAAVSGVSLRGVLRGGPEPERRGVLLETSYPRESFGWAPLRGLRTPEWSWIRAPHSELYRLTDDPDERTNLAAGESKTAGALDRWMSEQFRAEEGAATNPAQAGEVPAEVAERLSSLGYITSSAPTPAGASPDSLPDPKSMLAILDDFEVAKLAMDQRRFRDAIPPFRRVVARDARNLTSALGLGIALDRTHAFQEAEIALRHALELSPRNTTALSALADALFGQRRYTDALDLYRRAAVDALERRKAQSRIVSCLLALGRADEADAALAEARRSDPASRDRLENLAQRVAAYRRASAAAAEGGGANDSLRLAQVRAAAALDLVAEVDRLLQRPAAGEKWEAQRLELLTLSQGETGRAAAALETLRRLQRLRGATHQSRLYEADLLLEMDRPADALAILEGLRADAAVPAEARPTVEYRRAVALVRLNRADDAIATLREANRLGFRDGEQMLSDAELFPLRTRSAFRDLAEEMAEGAGGGR
jgi:arylsulfatase A-like enzyme/Tfp pilus assembly protein PilF